MSRKIGKGRSVASSLAFAAGIGRAIAAKFAFPWAAQSRPAFVAAGSRRRAFWDEQAAARTTSTPPEFLDPIATRQRIRAFARRTSKEAITHVRPRPPAVNPSPVQVAAMTRHRRNAKRKADRRNRRLIERKAAERKEAAR